jgi:uncharacterized protein YciI
LDDCNNSTRIYYFLDIYYLCLCNISEKLEFKQKHTPKHRERTKEIKRSDGSRLIWHFPREAEQGLFGTDNHRRAIAAQLLCNLAKNDPEGRMLGDFSALMEVTKDNRFVTARHCLQSLWKIGMAGKQQKEILLNGLDPLL